MMVLPARPMRRRALWRTLRADSSAWSMVPTPMGARRAFFLGANQFSAERSSFSPLPKGLTFRSSCLRKLWPWTRRTISAGKYKFSAKYFFRRSYMALLVAVVGKAIYISSVPRRAAIRRARARAASVLPSPVGASMMVKVGSCKRVSGMWSMAAWSGRGAKPNNSAKSVGA